MSVLYTWVPNPLKPGTYYARVVPQGAVRSADLVHAISKSTLIQPVDVHAVLDALDDEIADALLGGRTVILDDFLGFTVSLELKDPQAANSPTVTLTTSDVTLRVNASVRSPVARRVRARLALEQTIARVRQPQVEEIFDHLAQTTGQYSAGGVIDVRGKDLDLPEDFASDPTQGVFFIDAGGAVTRADVYIREGNKTITCMVPAGAGGPVTIEVRTTYGGPNLRSGGIEGVAQA